MSVENDKTSDLLEALEILDRFHLELTKPIDVDARRVLSQEPTVAVIGLVSRGKSTLVNRLIGADLLPTGPNPVTFGLGYLSSGPPSATGYDRRGREISLPVEVDSFRHETRRHAQQKISDFEYRGDLRIPLGVRLVDTKGLDEAQTNYDPEIRELGMSWSEQGAVGAVLVSSVPPGASAQDITLYGSVRRHFGDNVLVVVKRIDSSISTEDLASAASVWRTRKARTVVVDDVSPESLHSWGSGPLAAIENQISAMWESATNKKSAAYERLDRFVSANIRRLPRPSETTRPAVTRAVIDEILEVGVGRDDLAQKLMQLLVDDFDHQPRQIRNLEELRRTMWVAQMGSSKALEQIEIALRPRSALREREPYLGVLELCESGLRQEDALLAGLVPSSMKELDDLLGFTESRRSMAQWIRRSIDKAMKSFIHGAARETDVLSILDLFISHGELGGAEWCVQRLVELWTGYSQVWERLPSLGVSEERTLRLAAGLLGPKMMEPGQTRTSIVHACGQLEAGRVSAPEPSNTSGLERRRALVAKEHGMAVGRGNLAARLAILLSEASGGDIPEGLDEVVQRWKPGGEKVTAAAAAVRWSNSESEQVESAALFLGSIMYGCFSAAAVSVIVMPKTWIWLTITVFLVACALKARGVRRDLASDGFVEGNDYPIVNADDEPPHWFKFWRSTSLKT